MKEIIDVIRSDVKSFVLDLAGCLTLFLGGVAIYVILAHFIP